MKLQRRHRCTCTIAIWSAHRRSHIIRVEVPALGIGKVVNGADTAVIEAESEILHDGYKKIYAQIVL